MGVVASVVASVDAGKYLTSRCFNLFCVCKHHHVWVEIGMKSQALLRPHP